jgi:hypothetical protein
MQRHLTKTLTGLFLAGCLAATPLDKFKVAAADKQILLGVLGPMKKDIVTK